MVKTNDVTLLMDGQIAYMMLHNGTQNKLVHPEFINLSILQKFLEENNPLALVIKGEKRHFSAGADIDVIFQNKYFSSDLKNELDRGKKLLDYIEKLPCITIAEVSGICCGGGLEIALCCQFRIVADNALFSFPECKLGLLPGMGGTVRLQKLIGKNKAIKMIVSGEGCFASEAYDIGLVDKVCEKNMLDQTVKEFIKDICNGKSSEHISDIISTINLLSYEQETEMFIKKMATM